VRLRPPVVVLQPDDEAQAHLARAVDHVFRWERVGADGVQTGLRNRYEVGDDPVPFREQLAVFAGPEAPVGRSADAERLSVEAQELAVDSDARKLRGLRWERA